VKWKEIEMDFLKLDKLTSIAFRVLMTLIGTFIISVSLNALYIPHQLLSGGITAIAILANLKLGWSISLVILLLNIPILIIGYKFINKEFIVFSLLGMVSLSFFIWLTQDLVFQSENMLTTILLGGLMNGLGFGIIFRANSSTGGTDIVSKVLNRKFSYSIATFNFAFNLLIIGLSVTVFSLDIAVETLTAMYVSSLTATFVLEGTNHKRTILIITKRSDKIAEVINLHMNRGCTVIQGVGTYTGNEREILYAVISINQVAKLKMIVRDIDPNAFVNVIETKVVFGNGFLNLEEK